MALPKRCLPRSKPTQAEGVNIDNRHGREWEDGTPRSQGNDFEWDNGSLSIFATVKEKREKAAEEK